MNVPEVIGLMAVSNVAGVLVAIAAYEGVRGLIQEWLNTKQAETK